MNIQVGELPEQFSSAWWNYLNADKTTLWGSQDCPGGWGGTRMVGRNISSMAKPDEGRLPASRWRPRRRIRLQFGPHRLWSHPRCALVAGLLGTAVVVSWLVLIQPTSAASASPVAQAAPTTQGEQVFRANCAGCHGLQGEGGTEGPSLHALPAESATVPGVANVVRRGPNGMPPFANQLSDADVQAVADYVVSEFGTPGDAAQGGVLYRSELRWLSWRGYARGCVDLQQPQRPLADEPVQR